MVFASIGLLVVSLIVFAVADGVVHMSPWPGRQQLWNRCATMARLAPDGGATRRT